MNDCFKKKAYHIDMFSGEIQPVGIFGHENEMVNDDFFIALAMISGNGRTERVEKSKTEEQDHKGKQYVNKHHCYVAFLCEL